MLKQLIKISIACLLFSFGQSAQLLASDSWLQWRGSNRDGLTIATVPNEWTEHLLNQVWQVEIGEGHANPLVVEDSVFVFARQEDREIVRLLDLKTGETVWQKSYDAPYEMNSAARGHGKGPKSTPVFFKDKIYTLGISGILSCFDANTGELKWQNNYSTQFDGALPLYGTAMSPLVANGLLIAHVGGHDNGALKALDTETGDEKWSWSGDGPAYTSPVIATFDGVEQIVTQTQTLCAGFALKTGELLWQLPYTTAWDQNVVTPIIFNDTVIFSGLKKGTETYRPKKTDGSWEIEQIWHNKDVSMYMSSPVLIGNQLYGHAHTQKGHFFCLDATTGKTLWQSEGRQGEQAALIAAGNIILAQTSSSDLIIFEQNKDRYKPIAQYQIAQSPTWAPPVLIDNHLLIKDLLHVTLLQMK